MPQIPGTNFFRNLRHTRTLLFQLVRRDFQQRFVGSAAGWLWGLIHPLVQLAVWTFVFQICLGLEMPAGSITDNYTVFLSCGFLPWLLFSETVTRSTSSLLDQANLITKTVFPSEIVSIAVFLSALISHLMALAMVLVFVAIWAEGISPMAWLLPVYMLLLGMFAVGFGWIMSSLQVYLRDTGQVLQILMTLWFWMTPIFITESQVPERFRFIIRWNPMSYVVNAYRERLLSYNVPSMTEFAILCACALVMFVGGGLFFRHLKRGFADVL